MPRMAPAVSALARQTMTAAFEDLERTVSPADAREMRSITTLQQVRAAALDIEKQLAARQALRNMRRLIPTLNGLEHYAKVVDVLCNGTPFLSWIWSPITLILRVASEYVEAFEQLIKGYARIAAALGRFELLSNTFTDADFQHSLAVFYANILQFHKHAYNFVRRSGWRLLFLTSWGRFQRRFDNILEDLDRHGDLIDRAANARNISEARQLRQDIRTWKEESLEQVRQNEEHQATKQHRSILSWLRIDETEQLSMFESISEEASKFPGTCAWMLKNERICSWLQRKPSGNLLWLKGNPGSGKSVMSTELVKFLRSSTSFVMNYSCSQTFASSTKYEIFLKSLLHQLLRKSGELVAYTYQEFVVGKRLPTTSNLEQLLETLLSALSEAGHTEYVWIIVDGVEDCEIARQARLITFLSQIAKPGMRGNTVCKVLITSRANPIRLKRIWQKQLVSLSDETEQLTKAIKLYASQRLRLLHDRFQQLELDGDDVELIEQMVAQKAAGMFLYARLVLDYIGTNIFYSRDELKQSIDQLPETITEFYRNILAQMLSRFDSRSADRIRCTLGWIAYARRPLKRLELLSALAFSSGDPGVTSPAPRYMLELCSPLVEERRDTTLSFIHVSVKEFLQSSPSAVAINEHDALREHALATVTCLLAAIQVFDNGYQEQKRLRRLVKGVHAFHVYSTEYWTEYVLANAATAHGLEASPTLITLASRLAKALGMISSAPLAQLATSSSPVDDRLRLLDRHPELKTQIEKALFARSAKRLESEILGQPCATNIYLLDGVSKILNAYQKGVEIILDLDFCPGASTEELELFKSHFRASAYTCRLRSCPRATVGFDSGQLRREHEIGHAGGFRCSFPGCHYPPFRTAQSLDLHGQKYHTTNPSRRSIRRIGQLPSAQPTSNSTTNTMKANNTQALSERGNSDDGALEGTPGPTKAQISSLVGDTEPPPDQVKPLSGSSRASPNPDLGTVQCICGSDRGRVGVILCKDCNTWQHLSCYYVHSREAPVIHRCRSCHQSPSLVMPNYETQQEDVAKDLPETAVPHPNSLVSYTADELPAPPFGNSNSQLGAVGSDMAKASVRTKTLPRLGELIESSITASDNTELEVWPATAHIQPTRESSSLINPSTGEDFNDPKVIASAVRLPIPTSGDFPLLSELHQFVGPGISIAGLVRILFGKVQIEHVELLVLMLDMVSHYDQRRQYLSPMGFTRDWKMIDIETVMWEITSYNLLLERYPKLQNAIMDELSRYTANITSHFHSPAPPHLLTGSNSRPLPTALRPFSEEIRAFDIPEEDSSMSKDGMATRNSHHSPVRISDGTQPDFWSPPEVSSASQPAPFPVPDPRPLGFGYLPPISQPDPGMNPYTLSTGYGYPHVSTSILPPLRDGPTIPNAPTTEDRVAGWTEENGVRTFKVLEQDSSVKSWSSTRKRLGISSKEAKRTFGQVSDSTANEKDAKRPHKEGEEPIHTTNGKAADYVVRS